MLLNEVKENGLTIKCEKRDMGWGIDFALVAYFPEFLSSKWKSDNKETVRGIARYCANKLELQMLTDAFEIMRRMKQYGFEMPDESDAVLLPLGSGKSALFRPFVFQGKMQIDPYINFNSTNEHGFTLTPGLFSDFIITERSASESLFGYTKDFMDTHFGIASLYLLDFCNLCEVYSKSKTLPSDFEEFSAYNFSHTNPKSLEAKQKIIETVDSLTSLNKSKRIDSLIVNKKNVYDYIRLHNITSSFSVRGVTSLNIAIKLGKPMRQVENFIKKYLDKRRVS